MPLINAYNANIHVKGDTEILFVIKTKSKKGLRFKGMRGDVGNELVSSIYELMQVQINDMGCMRII